MEVYQDCSLNELETFLEKKYQNILNYLSPNFIEILNKNIFYDLLGIMQTLNQNMLLKELAKYELEDDYSKCLHFKKHIGSLNDAIYQHMSNKLLQFMIKKKQLLKDDVKSTANLKG